MANHYTPENLLEPDGYHLPSSQVLERPCHNHMSRDKEKLDVNNRMRGLCLRKIAPTAANK